MHENPSDRSLLYGLGATTTNIAAHDVVVL